MQSCGLLVTHVAFAIPGTVECYCASKLNSLQAGKPFIARGYSGAAGLKIQLCWQLLQAYQLQLHTIMHLKQPCFYS